MCDGAGSGLLALVGREIAMPIDGRLLVLNERASGKINDSVPAGEYERDEATCWLVLVGPCVGSPGRRPMGVVAFSLLSMMARRDGKGHVTGPRHRCSGDLSDPHRAVVVGAHLQEDTHQDSSFHSTGPRDRDHPGCPGRGTTPRALQPDAIPVPLQVWVCR